MHTKKLRSANRAGGPTLPFVVFCTTMHTISPGRNRVNFQILAYLLTIDLLYVVADTGGGGGRVITPPPLVAENFVCSNSNFSPTGAITPDHPHPPCGHHPPPPPPPSGHPVSAPGMALDAYHIDSVNTCYD